ncbi:hypothetical protein HNQ91_002027 [Filimonas zeae]|uniref:6-bladed beta-propeller protein n=1 Tax=Filimonas zeae TaxID=1737353 RepID=A0A917IVD8_9BACT|nr:hypothetical protein [Filimonas zeae]MDR6338976.1 hypothetical protein [Filimonas zeae]GGH65696.1 hypothetical protein GCM10011379_19100 [Filimonas zeae]
MAIFFLRKNTDVLLVLVLFVLLLPGCHQQRTRTEKVFAGKQLMYQLVQLDSIPMVSPLFYTEGFFRVHNHRIYLFDYDHCSVQVFDTAGNFLDTLLTENTIGEYRYGGFTPDGSIYLLDKNNQMRFFDSTGKQRGQPVALNWQRSKLTYEKEEYTAIGTYSIDIQERPYDTRWLPFDAQQRLLIPLWISPHINKQFNRYRWQSGYYQQAALLGAVQLPAAQVQSVFCKRSSLYTAVFNNIPDFDFGSADVRDDTIYVSEAIDSAIHVYAPDQSYLYSFGRQGQHMNQQYPQTTNEKKDRVASSKALSETGYYYHIFCDPSSRLVFRSHTTQKGSGSGLQVYQHGVLVAEAAVPQRFNVIGKIGDWYYADGMVGGYNRLLGVFRFQLLRRSL